MVSFLFLLAGALLGGAVAWLWRGSELAAARARLEERERALDGRLAASEQRLQGVVREDLAQARGELEKAVSPVGAALEKLDRELRGLEAKREGAYAALSSQVTGLLAVQGQLASQTRGLADALSRPEVRGRWGELTLLRAVELAGLTERCDFDAQASQKSLADGLLRPDLVVRLPGGKNVVVDSKAPLSAFLEAAEEGDAERREARLADYLRHVRKHVEQLSAKAYWERLQPAPEVVVAFLPGEAFFSAAVRGEPGLLEWAAERRVLLASPTTLIGLLKAVAQGWREEAVQEDARRVRDLGAELYKRLCSMGDAFAKLGKGLRGAVEAYNGAVGSLESRVLVTARKLEELHAAPAGEKLPELSTLDASPRPIGAEELLPASESRIGAR